MCLSNFVDHRIFDARRQELFTGGSGLNMSYNSHSHSSSLSLSLSVCKLWRFNSNILSAYVHYYCELKEGKKPKQSIHTQVYVEANITPIRAL